jgi:hypothetical protein
MRFIRTYTGRKGQTHHAVVEGDNSYLVTEWGKGRISLAVKFLV